jgi:hypothetical protein
MERASTVSLSTISLGCASGRVLFSALFPRIFHMLLPGTESRLVEDHVENFFLAIFFHTFTVETTLSLFQRPSNRVMLLATMKSTLQSKIHFP